MTFLFPVSLQAQEIDLVIGDGDEDVTDPPPSFSPPTSTVFCLTLAASNTITINVDDTAFPLSAGSPVVQIALFDLSASKVFDQTYNNSTLQGTNAGVKSYQTVFDLPNVASLPEGDYYMRIKLIDNTNFNRQAVYDNPATPGPEKDTFFPVSCSESCSEVVEPAEPVEPEEPVEPVEPEKTDMMTWIICLLLLLGLIAGGLWYRKQNL
ncbi:MAG: hypothetical protein AAF587_04590 [Bacteroidota bacterium]